MSRSMRKKKSNKSKKWFIFNRVPEAFSGEGKPDIDWVTNEPVVFDRCFQINNTSDK